MTAHIGIAACSAEGASLCYRTIPLIMNDGNSPLPTLDSTRLLARAALRRAMAPGAKLGHGQSGHAAD